MAHLNSTLEVPERRWCLVGWYLKGIGTLPRAQGVIDRTKPSPELPRGVEQQPGGAFWRGRAVCDGPAPSSEGCAR